MERQMTVVGGFAFFDKKAALKARHEAESIRYLKSQIKMENPRMVLEFYKKLMAEEVFETPVGLMFLKELYDYLIQFPEFKAGLEPIQTDKMARFLLGGTSAEAPFGDKASQLQNPPLEEEGQGREEFQREEEMASLYEEKLSKAKQKVHSAEQRQKRAEEGLRKRKSSLRLSRILNVFFLLVVIGMLVITLADNQPNILNYENKILDKYAQWEMELEEREAQLKEKERKSQGE